MGIGYSTYKVFLEKLLYELRARFGEDKILSFALFGSVARGEASVESDIDILIVHTEIDFDPVKELVKILFKLKENEEYERLRKQGLKPDPYPIFMTEKELMENPLILLDILDHGIIIHDTGVLKDRLNALKMRLTELGSKKVYLKDGSWYWDLKPNWKPGEVIIL
ncbi:MAG TPA: nucleotidyltransferase family protein [Candidatus Brocadiia bacterium]|nr:nucleotidyltransferase domain-containing protein [Candidatus Brocadiales bacterium]